jgi:hypothetical protein
MPCNEFRFTKELGMGPMKAPIAEGRKMGRRIFGALFLFFIMSLAWNRSGWAQIVPSDQESLIVFPVAVPKTVGTNFFIEIGLANQRPIAALSGRLVFDPNLIAPVTSGQDVLFDRIERGDTMVNWGASSHEPGAVIFGMFGLEIDTVLIEHIIPPGSGPVGRFHFTVLASVDTTICIRFQDNPADTEDVKNQLSTDQGLLITPSLGPASLQIGTGSPTGGCGVVPGDTVGNDPPIINPIGPKSIEQGSVLSFAVTASDPNGDNVTLSATALPQNATFTTVTGDSVVSGTFTFAPSLSQVGNFTATFRAVDDSGEAVTLPIAITVTEVLKDVLFSSSVTGKAPTGAIPGKSPAVFPIDLTAREQVYGINFDLLLDTAVIRLDSVIPTERLQNFIIDYRNPGGQLDRVRFLVFSLQGDSVRPAPLPTIMHLALSVAPTALPGKSNVVIERGFEVVRPGGPSLGLLTQSGEFFIDRFGDANLDTLIDVADVVVLIAHILGNYTFSSRQFDAADTDRDLLANIVDLVNIINLIFDIPLPPAVPKYIGPPATLALNARPFAFNPGEPIRLEAELPTDIAGVQVDIKYNPTELKLNGPEKTSESKGLDLRYLDNENGKLSFVLYNIGGSDNEIPPGQKTILEIPATRLTGIGDTIPPKLTITKAYLSTGKGEGVPVAGIGANVPRQFELSQNYPNPFNPKTTIQFKVASADADGSPVPVKLEVFNILGQSVKTLVDERRAPGTYTLEWDGTDRSGSRVSSGVYLYRFTFKGFSVTKKMVFLK